MSQGTALKKSEHVGLTREPSDSVPRGDNHNQDRSASSAITQTAIATCCSPSGASKQQLAVLWGTCLKLITFAARLRHPFWGIRPEGC